jgi:hypothetical protein
MVSPNETNADIYVVRPDTKFVNDSDPNYFEFRYPDIFPFGRGGTHEKRRIKISRKALLAYMLNLSTRQFQEVDFVLPVYDMVTRQQVSTIGFVRSQIPSRKTNADGTVSSKAEAFGRVSLLDMKKVCEHKIACVKSASKGGTLPPPPQSVSGMAAEFFNDVSVATSYNQHSKSAAMANRAAVYAAHNSLGRASIWFTFCPDDTQSFKILWYALGSSLIYFKDSYTTVPITQCYFKVPVTFWNSMAIEVQRYPSGTTINLKGVYVTSHQGRQALKATSLTGVEVNKSYYTISM